MYDILVRCYGVLLIYMSITLMNGDFINILVVQIFLVL